MDLLELLTTRRSSKRLVAPAPDELQLDTILQSATQVPDHGDLKPWRFIVVHTPEGFEKFRTACVKTVNDNNMGEEALKKANRISSFAPMMIAVIFTPKTGKPEWEQMLSAGSSAYAIQLASLAQGFDNAWITGMWVNSADVREAFGCGEKDKIIGLMMIGTLDSESVGENAQSIHQPKNTDVNEFTAFW